LQWVGNDQSFKQSVKPEMNKEQAKFGIGQIVRHAQFGYRGVIADVDPQYLGSEEWYAEAMEEETAHPTKRQPWYHILVDQDSAQTYVAEQSLRSDGSIDPVEHPYMDVFFSGFESDHYVTRQPIN
jgi:heat shock protein HspQ